jgi:hypothetical protein
VKTAIRGALANLAGIALLLCGQAMAQQVSTTDEAASAKQGEPELGAAESAYSSLTPVPQQLDTQESYASALSDGDVFGSAATAPCCEVCGGGSCCPPEWYTEQGVRVLTRSKLRKGTLTYSLDFYSIDTLNPVTGEVTTEEGFALDPWTTYGWLGFDVAPGYNMTLGRYLGRDSENRDHFLEFSYWGLNHWDVSREVHGERYVTSDVFTVDNLPVTYTVEFGSLATGFEINSNQPEASRVGGFNRADQHFYSYSSDMNNFELNLRLRPRGRPDRLVLHPNGKWRRECQPGEYTSFLFGLRLMTVDEGFVWHSRGSIGIWNDTEEKFFYSPVSGDYLISTHNNLLGLQFGGEYTVRRCKWTWGMRIKGGPFINFSDQASTVTTDAAGDINDPRDPYVTFPLEGVALGDLNIRRAANNAGASLLGELGFVGSYKVNPHLALRAAYDFMWVTGLAFAPEQITFDVNPPNKVNDNGHAYYHGLSLGGEFVW